MADAQTTTVNNAQKTCNKQTVSTETIGTLTKTTTQNCEKNMQETVTIAPDGNNILKGKCPCGRFNLDKLSKESRAYSFKSSNSALAISNGIVIFAMLVLEEILKKQCHCDKVNLDEIFLITEAIVALGDGLQLNNPQPFNS